MTRTMVFHLTKRLLTPEEAAVFVGVDASVHLHGVEFGAGTITSAEPMNKLGRPGLWITMESAA